MSTATVTYFHSASLRDRYINELENAFQGNLVSADEQMWLQNLVRPLAAGGLDPVRVDRLTIDSLTNPFELAAALLLSHARTDDPQVYLYTLANGLERFADRRSLLAALRERFAGQKAESLFEYEKIDGDPFRAQMLAIIDHQADSVGQLTAQLKQIPSLLAACTASLSEQLRLTLPLMPVDPKTHLVQLVRESDNADDAVPTTSTLAQVAFDDRCNGKVEEGLVRRFLDIRGLPASEADALLFTQALADATNNVGRSYGTLLSEFWGGPAADAQTRRDLAIESFSRSLRHELYCGLHESTFSAGTLKAMLPLLGAALRTSALGVEILCKRLTLQVGGGARVTLAGTFVVQSAVDARRSLLWFSPKHKLVRFTDLAALTSYFSSVSGRAQIRPLLALADQSVLTGSGQWQIDLESIQTPLAADRVDSILTLQARNLSYVMDLSGDPDQTPVMIDDALDVRQLLDPRQLQLSAGRWRPEAPFDFSDIWLVPGSDSPAEMTVLEGEVLTVEGDEAEHGESGSEVPVITSLVEYAQFLDSRADRLRQVAHVLPEYAGQSLQQYISVLVGDAPLARDIRVQWVESAQQSPSGGEPQASSASDSRQVVSMDLVSLLLECISGRRSHVLPVGSQVLLDSSSEPRQLQIDLISHVIERVATGFTERYITRFTDSRAAPQRYDNQQIQLTNEALRVREDAMRLDLKLAQRQTRLDSVALGMAQQVMGRPARALRLWLGVPVTEAYSVTLAYDNNPGIMLCDTFVLRQPLDQTHPVVLWACNFGWRQYDSAEQLQNSLERALHGSGRERWLDLVGEGHSRQLRTHLMKASGNQVQITLTRLDGHAIEALQALEMKREQQNLQQLCLRALRCRFEAGLFTRLAGAAEVDEPLGDMLDGLSVRIKNSIFVAMLPPWVDMASAEDLQLCHEILGRYFESGEGGKDFLFGITTVLEFTREQLAARLKRDFPAQQLDPEQITVTSRRYVSAFPPAGELPSGVAAAVTVHSESLTRYAINRLIDAPDAALSVSSASQPQAASLLTPDYLRQLVRELDTGARYTAMVRKAISPDDVNYPERERLFVKQAPSAMQLMALPDKVQGDISAQGFGFISSVLDMPDGIARERVAGVRVILSPLQLVADPGMTPDRVAGLYLIGAEDPGTGPVVLCAMHHPQFLYLEFANQTALMQAIRSDASLQQLLLERLEPEVRRRYNHNGFTEPHLPFAVGGFGDVPLRAPGPVALELVEIKGNALQEFFRETLKLLLDFGISNVVTNEQADYAARKFLAELALSQALTLLPSRLAALMTLWQSHSLFRASAISASGHRWGQAFSEFTAALGVMATAREQAIEEGAEGGSRSQLSVDEEEGLSAEFSWDGTSLTVDQQIRLRALEAQNVALNEMLHDSLLNIFRDKVTQTPYAVVAGKVYQVIRGVEGGWSIVGLDGTPGPKLVLDGNQRWQLDLDLRLRGGGGVVTRLKESMATSFAQEGLVIEASGMPEIRSRYRDRAQSIGHAHARARRYLENALDNLNIRAPGDALDPRVTRIIEEFFGASLDQQLRERVEGSVKALFDGAMDSSLSPLSSPRFVVGANRSGEERVTAFTIPKDPKQRIFLSEQFFSRPLYRLTPQALAEGFEVTRHSQAAVLIHELSHLVLDTKDIAYLEASAPYPDLLRINTPANIRTRAQVERLHDYGLSHRTDRNELFSLHDNGKWRDLGPDDALGYRTILRITTADTLEQARDIFLSVVEKRSQVMLKNADSVTLLILRLGRYNYAMPPQGR